MFQKFLLTAIAICAIHVSAMDVMAGSEKTDTLKTYRTPSVTVTTSNAVEGKSPVTFTQVSKADIEKTYSVRDLPDLLSDLPSMISYSQNGNAIGYSNLSMRGFNQYRISVMINGIPQNDPEDHNVYWIDFPDLASNLESIQVQRGAGMSNYGSAAIAGSINMTTANFANTRGVKLYIGGGMHEYNDKGGAIKQPGMSKSLIEFSSGLVDNKYAFYGRLSKIHSDGYRDRSWAEMESYFFSVARFDENVFTQINIFGGPFSDGLAYTGLPKSYTTDLKLRRLNPSYWTYNASGDTVVTDWFTNRRKQEQEKFSQPHYEMLNDWLINDDLTFKSSLFYYTGDGYYDYDASWADGTLPQWMGKDYTFPEGKTLGQTLIRATVSNEQGGWIPRIIWKHGIGELTAGLEMRIHRSKHFGNIQYSELLPAGYDPDYRLYNYEGKRNIFSIFAREAVIMDDNLLLNIEAQFVNHSYAIGNEKWGNNYSSYTNKDGKLVGNGDDLFNVKYNFINPRVGLNYNLDKSQNVYITTAYTSREPRMANLYSADWAFSGNKPLFEGDTVAGAFRYDFSKPLIKPESMFDLELGWNMKTEDYAISLNGYWMEYFDELVKSGRVDYFGNPIDDNAPRSRHIGIELQGAAVLARAWNGDLKISANVTFSKNQIIEYDFKAGNSETISLKDNPIAGFPDLLGNVRLSYTNENVYIGISGKYVGEMRSDNFGDLLNTNAKLITYLQNDMNGYYNDNKIDPYFVANADLSYTFKDVLSVERIKLHFQINNIFNKLYAAGAEGKDFFPAAERNVFLSLELGL